MVTISDKILKASSGTRPKPTTLTANKGIGDALLNADDLTGWATDTPVTFVLFKVDTSGNEIVDTRTDWKGIVSGNTITQLLLTAGVDTIYPSGSPVIAAATARWADDLASALLVSHNQNGTLKDGTVSDTTIVDGAVTYAKFLPTILSGQVQSFSPGGAFGGSAFYVNNGGIKEFWALSATQTISAAGFASTNISCTLPTSFFSTITTVQATSRIVSNTEYQNAVVNTVSTSAVNVYITQYSGTNGQQQVYLYVRGT